MTSNEKIGLSRMWARAAAPTPRTTFTCTGVALMSGRPLPAWPRRSVVLRRVTSAAGLEGLVERVRRAEKLHARRLGPAETRLPCGSPDRGYDPMSSLAAGPSERSVGGLSERVVAALTANDAGADLLGFVVLTRRMLGNRFTLKGGEALLVDLEVDVEWLHVLPAVRGLGYGHALGAAVATTILADARRAAADLVDAPLPASICVSVSGVSRGAGADAVIRAAVAAAAAGLEGIEVGRDSSVVDLRLTDREFAYLAPSKGAGIWNDLIETETPRR